MLLTESLRTGKLVDVEFRAVRRRGGVALDASQGAPRYGPSGEIVRWYGTAEDINERRREIESWRQLTERNGNVSQATRKSRLLPS